jgi:hypothetical protein
MGTRDPTSLSLILSSLCGIGLDVIGKRVVWDGAKSNKMLSFYGFFQLSLLQNILYLSKLGKFAV